MTDNPIMLLTYNIRQRTTMTFFINMLEKNTKLTHTWKSELCVRGSWWATTRGHYKQITKQTRVPIVPYRADCGICLTVLNSNKSEKAHLRLGELVPSYLIAIPAS